MARKPQANSDGARLSIVPLLLGPTCPRASAGNRGKTLSFSGNRPRDHINWYNMRGVRSRGTVIIHTSFPRARPVNVDKS